MIKPKEPNCVTHRITKIFEKLKQKISKEDVNCMRLKFNVQQETLNSIFSFLHFLRCGDKVCAVSLMYYTKNKLKKISFKPNW